jgi:hypothetical protein
MLRCYLALVATVALACAPSTDTGRAALGCGPNDAAIARMLASAGEKPWCSGRNSPKEGYRLIWGYPDSALVVSVTNLADSAGVHAHAPAIVYFDDRIFQRVDTLAPIDTTYPIPRSFFKAIRDIEFHEPYWREERIDVAPEPPVVPIFAIEFVRKGKYHAGVRWVEPRIGDRFGAAANRLAGKAGAFEHFQVGGTDARRRANQGEIRP